jgi:hypothetical protein
MGGDLIGSLWNRWEPHIHAPGTVLNNEFGEDAWDDYIERLEKSEPQIRAIGVTDYYSIDTYEEVVRRKSQGKLADVGLVFPNVELRYGVGTGNNSPVNFHILVSPQDPDHVAELRRFLAKLTFNAYSESYRCERDDLIRLGRRHDNTLQDERSALKAGTNQFKVNFDQLKDEWGKSAWIQANGLVAVAGSNKDGTAGLQDASLASLRKEIERFAHIIFASQSSQRKFWLGKGPVAIEQLTAEWGGPKPCLHGSDAHKLEKVGNPDLDRRTWIKGDLTFEALRQACIEPEARAFVGDAPPVAGLDSQSIRALTVTDAPWMITPEIPLNPGLVGIIGARGSGKTALADMIAAAGFAPSSHLMGKSFLDRARLRLGNASATLAWGQGETTTRALGGGADTSFLGSARVQYLSQHFVEELCSADGVNGELLREIERVVFQAFPVEERLGATSFAELLELRTSGARGTRRQNQEWLEAASRRINADTRKLRQLPQLKSLRNEKATSLSNDRDTRKTMVTGGGADRSQRLEELTAAATAVERTVEDARRKLQALSDLQAEVQSMRSMRLPELLSDLQRRHSEVDLTDDAWQKFALVFAGDVDSVLSEQTSVLEATISNLVGEPLEVDLQSSSVDGSSAPVLPRMDATGLGDKTLTILRAEIKRLTGLVGLDKAKVQALDRLKGKIGRDEAEIAKLDRDIKNASAAPDRITAERSSRQSYYRDVFVALIEEEEELASLYAPLEARLNLEDGTLGKLSFSVRRIVDQETWARQGEELLDLRKSGPFRGKGSLLAAATSELMPAWQAGTSEEVGAAMDTFLHKHEEELATHAPVDPDESVAYVEWEQRVADWLYGTAHIKLAYSVLYEGADIEQLSPGTRGIVLLLLYLSLDRDDLRPLIIDQPEENLDPKSIFTELVDRFRQAKLRRQVILVTHNANLVVNTDADQVIVARSGPHRPGQLPEIRYLSGGLDNPQIRHEVCEILEGGEIAFQERARRLRVRL